MHTVTSHISALAEKAPDRVAVRFLPQTGEPAQRSYAQLDAAARRVAAALAARCEPGERALLTLPSGLEFVEAFLGCLRAGVIAVPMPTSARRDTTAGRSDAIVADSRPSVVISSSSSSVASSVGGLPVLALDALESDLSFDSDLAGADSIAYLQYSSGSTGTPKGVCDTHRCLLHQVGLLRSRWPWDEPIHVVGWLPLYHDMGMIYQLLLPLTSGGTATLMSPAGFAADPTSWLRAASRYRGNWIGGPDFAFRRCCDEFDAGAVAELDLSAVRYVANGAEPIRPDTLRRFAAHFEPAGLRAEAVSPAYGLAEAGLVVSHSDRPRGWRVAHYEADALAAGVAVRRAPGSVSGRAGSVSGSVVGRELASSGNYWHTWRLAIVDPDSRVELPERHVGEVWVGGPGLPAGYWNQPDLTAEVFGARLADGSGPFLRTGDLGFLDDGELVVCGRRKDLLIVHGVNHHPNDVEHTVEQACPTIAVGGVCAAQSADDHRVVILAEAPSDPASTDLAVVAGAVRAAVLDGHGLVPDEVVLVRRRASLRRTTSGKLRRAATLAAYLAGELRVLHTDGLRPREQELVPEHRLLLTTTVCQVLGVPAVDADAGFASLGLDSVRATRLAHELTVRLGRPVPVTLLYRHPTLRRLAEALDQPEAAGAGADAGASASGGDDRNRGHALSEQRTRAVETADTRGLAVAVVGVGVRLPGGVCDFDGAARWLLAGGDAIGPVPAARAADGVPLTVRGAYLDGVDLFDAAFFGISGQEARAMDPQQRLLLEVAWHALEHAGLPAGRLRHTDVGVFVGQGHHEYAMLPLRAGHPEWIGAFHAAGTSTSASAGRIAHHLGLTGPAITVDTACSASLVAIDTAVRHLASGTCSVALAGGVNVALSPETERSLLAAGMLSPRARCATLDASADGYARGEGAVLFVLKPLAAARADGDRVLGVIRGSAVAQDGASSGLTVPEPAAQAAVVRAALAAAGLAPADMDAVELHGTGTALGDPIEVAALAEVHAGRTTPLYVGSVKTNVGHLEAAAGAAGVLRALVALRHQAWPGHPTPAGGPTPNPLVVETGLPYRMPARTETAPLRRVGVSSFGFTGTIAHLVLEHPGPPPAPGAVPWSGWIPLSAATEAGLTAQAHHLATLLSDSGSPASAGAHAPPSSAVITGQWSNFDGDSRPQARDHDGVGQAEVLAAWRRYREHRLPWRAVVYGGDPAEMSAALARPLDAERVTGAGAVSLLVRPGDPVDALLDGMARWLPAACGARGVDGLVAALSAIGLRPHPTDGATRPPPGAVVLCLRPEPGAVLLDAADGGQAGLAQAYRRGAPLDWSTLDPGPVPLIDLPLYPFQRSRHWYPVATDPGSVPAAAPTTAVDATALAGDALAAGVSGEAEVVGVPGEPDDEADELTAEVMRAGVAAMLDRGPDSLGEADDLVAAGLESIDIHDLAARWRRAGAELSFAELFERPTLAAWWDLAQRRRAAGQETAPSPAVDAAAPFALTPVQHAYWVGRDEAQPLGGVGCHVYAELDGHGVDPARLERAVRALVERHDMLRARFTDDGQQVITATGAWAGLTVHDLRAMPDTGRDAELARIRDSGSHRVLDVARGEVFDLALTLLPCGATRLHFDVDMLVADALSLQLLLADLAALYTDEPGEGPPAIGTSFPQYLADRAARSAGNRERDRTYWLDRLPDLPGAPQLPVRLDPAQVRAPRFTRRQRRLDADRRAALVERARAIGVTPSVVLAAAFAEVLARWSEDPRFLLNLTLFDREDLHPDVPRLVADFTNVVLLTCEPADTFAERARLLQHRLRSDLAHTAYSGVEVLRDLARQGRPGAAPVVFTSNLGRDLLPTPVRDAFGDLGWTISQTPQVWLDHQVMEQAGGLLLSWDAVEDLFHPGVLDAMFAEYGRLVDWLVTADWNAPPPAPLPATQAQVRVAVNDTAAPVVAVDALLHKGFFDTARREPSRPAVVDGIVWTYGEVADQALRTAAALRQSGVAPGDLVGVSLPKGVDQVVAVLGVLAAGAAYVPIGVDQPPARRDRMVAASGVRLVLGEGGSMGSSRWRNLLPYKGMRWRM